MVIAEMLKVVGSDRAEDLLKLPGLEDFRPAVTKEVPKSKKVSAAAKALKEVTVAYHAAGNRKTQIEEKIGRWQSWLAQGQSDLLVAQLEFSDTGDQLKVCQDTYEAVIAEAPSQEVKEEKNGENGDPEDEDENMEPERAPPAPPEFTDFANTLEPDKRKLLDEHMAAMWQTATGKRRRKHETSGTDAKQAAAELEVAGRLFAAAAAKAAETAEAAARKEKEKEKTDNKAKGKAGDKSSLV